jgi:hypothetical protein
MVITMKIFWGAMALSFCLTSAALAQTTSTAPAAPTSVRQATGKPIKEVVQALGKAAGVAVLIDSSLLAERTTFKETDVTAATLEAALDKLVKTLPQGTAWAKAYLPEPPAGKKYTGDALAQYVMAQAGLFGKAGASQPGKIELLGQQVPSEEAQPMLSSLKLKPYYVLSRGRRPMLASGDPGEMMKRFGGGTNVIDLLMKQLNVSGIDQIQPGNYKVTLPGPDGTPVNADVVVEGDDGQKRVMVRMGEVRQ